MVKLNISYPANGTQKCVDIEDELKIRPFYEKRMCAEVTGDHLGDEWKGYVFRLTGGNDKQGFPMKQGVLTNRRVHLLLSAGQSTYRSRRKGERKRKSCRGCIVDNQMSVINLAIIKKGDSDIEGLTDTTKPRRLGPKRASKIRKLFNLSKDDDVRRYVIRRKIEKGEGDAKKTTSVAPKIQRLVTPQVLQHKRHRKALIKRRHTTAKDKAAKYAQLLAKRHAEEREARHQAHLKRRLSSHKSDA